MQILFILNDAPYSSEKSYNGLRTALQLLNEDESVKIKVFLIGESVGCALANQNPIASNFVVEKMLSEILSKGGNIKICKSCLDARGFTDSSLVEGTEISNMSEYAQWILKSDKIIAL